MTLEALRGRRVAVWGVGQEGLAMARLLLGQAIVPLFIDDRVLGAAGRLDAAIGTGHQVVEPAAVDWSQVDVVVRAPGVSRYRPELAAAAAAGVSVTTAMALWLSDFAGAPVVAVTGTKGKSTTAALAASLLGHDGLEVALIGNIGVPVVELYDRPPADAYVVEVSSYQAAEVSVTPGVCVLTSLAPDHLTWHGSEETYYRDKLQLIEAGPPGALAVNAASDEAVRRTDRHPGRTLYGPNGRVRVDSIGRLSADDEFLADVSGLRPPGRHNWWNLCGAVAGVALLTGRLPSADAVAATVDGFDGLPSRCRTVGQRDGVTFVDDALASNPFATEASVLAFPGRELAVILGGADRGVDPASLIAVLADRQPAPRVVVFPPAPQGLLDALDAVRGPDGSSLDVEVAADLAGAVAAAAHWTPRGGVVLFSPAAPTPDGEGGFAQRSRQFVEAAGLSGSEGR